MAGGFSCAVFQGSQAITERRNAAVSTWPAGQSGETAGIPLKGVPFPHRTIIYDLLF